MTPEQSAAYVNSQAACAMIEAMGMQAQNKQREIQGDYPVYDHNDFSRLIDEFGIHHNEVIARFFA